MDDKDFLNWVADRLVHVYGEKDNVDFVLKLRRVAQDGTEHDHSTNTCTGCANLDEFAYRQGKDHRHLP